MKKAPFLSVLMTVFNAEKYLEASLKSILHQTFSDWEFLIVDDASTDQSVKIVEAYAKNNSRIRLIKNEKNKGQTACLNQGLREASGYLVARQDADDLSHRLRFEKQVKRFQEESKLILLGTNGFIINEKNQRIGMLDLPLTYRVISWSAPLLNPLLHTAVMFQKNVIQDLGGYNEVFRIAQDYDLWVRVLQHHQVENLSERLVSYRHLETSLSKTGRSRAFEEADSISQQSELASFGRPLQLDERALIASFREGKITTSQRQLFWSLFSSLLSSLEDKNSLDEYDITRLAAAYHLKIAGMLAKNPLAALPEIMAACLTNARFVMSWFCMRVK